MNLHRDSSPHPKHFLSCLCRRPFAPGRCVASVAAPRWRFLYRCRLGGCPSRLAQRVCVCVGVFASTFSISFVCMDTNAIPPCSDRFHIMFLPVNTTDDVHMCTCAATAVAASFHVHVHVSQREREIERQQTPVHTRCSCLCVRFFLHADV